MSNKTTKASTERSATREELAAAIAHVATASQSSEAAGAAIARATDLVSKARASLDAAKEKSATEKEARTARIISAVTSGDVITQDRDSRSARREEADAADDLEEAEAALEAVKESIGDDHESELRRALARQKKAIDALLLDAAKRRMEEAEDIGKRLAEKIAVLRFFVSTVDYQPNVDFVQRINRFQGGFHVPDHVINQSVTERDAWCAAIEALKTDADAELPN